MSVVSKNLYDLLGNDPELDPDREPEPPTKVADKPVPRSGKRNGPSEAPVRDAAKPAAGGRGGRHEVFTGSEQAIRDKNAGAANNRSKPIDDGLRQDRHANRNREQGEHRGNNADRAGRGARGGRPFGGRGGTRTGRDDRHSRTNVGEHEKQAAHGWGAETGEAELDDEKGGLADAKEEEKEGVVATDTAPVDENGTPADKLPVEPEDNTKSYEQYLAEQLEKKAALNDRALELRKANEGSSKKFPEGKAFARGEEENFIAGSGGKAKRERERKAKTVVDIDQTWVEPAEGGDSRGGRGGRGGGGGRGRGGRGEGGFRGEGRGEGRGRGRGRGEGGFRGGDRGDRGSFRGRGGQSGNTPNITDSSAFPSLGGA